MEKDLVDIVMEKSYIELSANEKAELGAFCSSESEYNQLKDVFLEVEGMQFETFTPKKETKESLDSLFDDTYAKVTPIWYMSALAVIIPKEKAIHRQPLAQIAAIGLLFFLAYPFFSADVIDEVPSVAQVEVTQPEVKELKKEIKPEVIESVVSVPEVVEEPVLFTTVEPQPVVGAVSTGTEHPDGIFDSALEIAFSQPASEEPEMLDLLTAAF